MRQDTHHIEQWRPAVGYEGLYEVSDFGRIRGLEREKSNGKGIVQVKSAILNPWENRFGYLLVELNKNGKGQKIFVHRLVALAFIPNPENKPFIDHINTVKKDNKASNLRWCTRKENQENPITKKNWKEKHSGWNHTEEAKERIRNSQPHSRRVKQINSDGNVVKIWESIHRAAIETGISQPSITGVCNKRPHHNTAGGYKWEYVNE